MADFKESLDDKISDFLTKDIAIECDEEEKIKAARKQAVSKIDRVLWSFKSIAYYPPDLNDPEKMIIHLQIYILNQSKKKNDLMTKLEEEL